MRVGEQRVEQCRTSCRSWPSEPPASRLVACAASRRADGRLVLRPLAMSTVNGSPAWRAPTPTLHVAQPGAASAAPRARRRRSRASGRRAGRAPSPRRARAGRAPARGRRARGCGRLRRRRAPDLPAWCSACDSSATSTLASASGSFSSSPRLPGDVRDAAPARASARARRARRRERSTAMTRAAQRAASIVR